MATPITTPSPSMLALRQLLFPEESQAAQDHQDLGGMAQYLEGTTPVNAEFDPNSPANLAKRYVFHTGKAPTEPVV